jgi:GrpB-like predicted nucleotidyltransferase (UPF0157 family)
MWSADSCGDSARAVNELPPVIGLEDGRVLVASYSMEWPRFFAEEKSRLLTVVGDYVLDVQHVGSTSVPGLAAKPIVDIAIAVRNFEESGVCVRPIVELGYEFKGENAIPRRRYFERGSPTSFHLHINEIFSRAWENQILFRDYLIRHSDVAQDYAAIKIALARQFPFDRDSYLAAKGPFIERVLRRAREIGQE